MLEPKLQIIMVQQIHNAFFTLLIIEKKITQTMFCFAEKTAEEAPSSSLNSDKNGFFFPVSPPAITEKDLLYVFVILFLILRLSVTKELR